MAEPDPTLSVLLGALNPTVIVEVLSDMTEKHDRGIKFAHYRTIPSLQEVALVSHTERRVEHYRRLDTGQWLMTESMGPTGVVRFPALGCCEIPLADIYANAERFERIPTEPPAPM